MEQALTNSNRVAQAIVSVRSLVDIRRASQKYRDADPVARRAWLSAQVLYCNAVNHQKPDPEMMKADVAALDAIIAESPNLSDLTAPEIAFALFHGTLGEYGEYYGLTARTFAGFCREFLKTAVKQSATYEEKKAAEPERGSWVLERMEHHRQQVAAEYAEQEEREELDARLESIEKQHRNNP